MTFEEILDQAVSMLKRRGQLTYRTLKRQFGLDDEALEDLKDEILYSQPRVIDDEGKGLIWTGDIETKPNLSTPPAQQDASHQDQPTQLEPPPPRTPTPDAERRQLTVMFSDLVDSTKLAGQLDPEDYREVVRAYQSICAEVIQRFEGFIAQHLGDALLVYFGYPQAHEDDAQRAIHTGLRMLQAMQSLNERLEQEKGIRLAIRVGIHTGLTVVGDIGEGSKHELLALGEAPNVASRIQGVTGPDTVAISAETCRLVEGYFTLEDLGLYTLKGVATPMQIYRVLGESGTQSRLEIAATKGLTPLVGREQEIGLLLERWAHVKDGQGQVVLLSGEPGIGKSRLVQVLKDHVASEPYYRWECRCSPYFQNSAFYPVIDLFQRAFDFRRDDVPADKLRKIEETLIPYVALPEVMPLFASMLSVPLDDRYPPLTLTPERQKRKTLEAVLTLLLAVAAQQPVLFIVEDLHWLDPSTLELLDLCIDQAPMASILALLTCRPAFQPSWHHRSYLTEVTINRLSRNHIERMAEQVAGGKRLPDEVLQQIVEKTDGVPLFVEEMTKAVLESGALKETNENYELAGSLTTLAIPTTIQDSLMARLDRLMTAKGIAQLGAVIGRQFSYELLHAVAQVDAPTLQRELRRLVEAELLYQRGVLPQATYTFKHALIQDAAYQSLLKRTRQQYHERIVKVLIEKFADTVENQPELVARHCAEAGLHMQAAKYWCQAGYHAISRPAYREAVANYEQALTALQHLPETPDTTQEKIEIHLSVRVPLYALGAFAQILEHLREAESLAERVGDPQQLARCLAYLGNYFTSTYQSRHALEVCQRALVIATRQGDAALLANAQYRLSRAYFNIGDFRQAIALLTEVVESLSGELRYAFLGYTAPLSVVSRYLLAWVLGLKGAFSEGQTYGEEALQIADEIEHPFSRLFAGQGLGVLHLNRGNLMQAIPILERVLALGQAADIPFLRPETTTALGLAYALSGRVTEALPLVEEAAERYRLMTGGEPPAFVVSTQSYVYRLAGRFDEAITLARHALDLAEDRQERGCQGRIHWLLGELSAHSDPSDAEQAEASYRQAFELATELGMRPLQAHCHFSLGALYTNTARSDQAYTELSTAIEMYRDMGMAFWLSQAEIGLTQVKG